MSCVYELANLCVDKNGEPLPFSRINMPMASVSLNHACEGMGLRQKKWFRGGGPFSKINRLTTDLKMAQVIGYDNEEILRRIIN